MKTAFKNLSFLIGFNLLSLMLHAQSDSLLFRNNTYMLGKVKSLDRNVVMVETSYSDKDFAIEWHRVQEIYTNTYFLISLTDGSRYNGTLASYEPGRVEILTDEGESVETNLIDIVYLDDLDKGFWSQLYYSIDIGFDLTKANNFKQFSSNSRLGYNAKRWNLDLTYNNLFSTQDETEDIRRIDGGAHYKYFLPHDWYPMASIDFLSNTEQRLNLRTTGKIGFGKFFVHTNKSYWGASVGVNYNKENFSDETTSDRNSMEGFLGTELNMFNVGDIDLLSKFIAYPSFTEKRRWRMDFNIETRYEMWFDDDFYIKFSYSLNFDNQPIEGASSTDYVFHTGFGWEW